MYKLKYNADGLIPVVTVDAVTDEVLMQAYMNKEAFDMTMKTGDAWYWSRSRGKLWHKGEESGHFQRVVSVYADCDFDCLMLRVRQVGGTACHTGSRSCFINELKSFEEAPGKTTVLRALDEIISSRAENPREGSYTNYLLNKGVEKICKKVGEESTETVIAAMKGDNNELLGEIADLLYHLFVLMRCCGAKYSDVLKVLENRHACGADTPAREAKPKKSRNNFSKNEKSFDKPANF